MDHGLVALLILSVATLLLFLGVAWVINKAVKRQLLNGAAVFFWLLVCAIVGTIAYQLSLPKVTSEMGYAAGETVAALSPVLLLSLILMLRFRRRKRLALERVRRT
jgi:hypothetical protein